MIEQGTTRQALDTEIRRGEPFPENPNARFEAIFAAIGNSEVKCATILLASEIPATGSEMQRRFREQVGSSWVPHTGTFHDYFETLGAAGLIVKTVSGFTRTEAGEKYGKPIAAYLLQQTSPFFSLEEFGQTARAHDSSRAVVNRADILSLLSKLDRPVSTSELIATLSWDQNRLIFNHLTALKNLGLIEYSSRDDLAVYAVKEDGKIPTYHTSIMTLKRRIQETITVMGAADAGLIAKKLHQYYPKNKFKTFRGHISVALAKLATEGFLQRDFVNKVYLTQTRITPLGVFVARGIIDPVRDALSGNHPELLDAWKAIPWKVYVKHGVDKFEKATNRINANDPAYAASEVLKIIRANPDIDRRTLENIYGRDAYDALKKLRAEDLVISGRQGNKLTYTINSNLPISS